MLSSSNDRHAVLVVGIGNEIRRDDAVGLVVAAQVKGRLSSTDRVTVKQLSAGGWQLFHEMEGYDRLIVVDAFLTDSRCEGRLRVHRPSDLLPVQEVSAAAAHLLSIPDAIALSKRYGYHTPTLVGIVTIDVGKSCLVFGTGLAPKVAAAVPGAVDAVMELIKSA